MGTKYTKEFKAEAIRLGEREGVSAASEKLESVSNRCMHGSVPSGWNGEKRRKGFVRERVQSKDLNA